MIQLQTAKHSLSYLKHYIRITVAFHNTECSSIGENGSKRKYLFNPTYSDLNIMSNDMHR